MKNQEFIKMIRIIILITLLMPFLTQYSYSQLSSPNGVIDLGNQQLYGNNESALYWNSNNSGTTQMIFRDKEDTEYGRIYGGENGTHFGLFDGDGNWSYVAAKDDYTAFRINDIERMRIEANGNVGIGTDNPQAILDVGEFIPDGKIGTIFGRLPEGNHSLDGTYLGVKGHQTQGSDINNIKSFSLVHNFYGETNSSINFYRGEGEIGGFLTFNTSNDNERMRILPDGNVGIGTTTPQHKLDVCGTIRAQEVIVEEGWCDFVFEPEYCLTTLEEEADFIKLYGHLSNFKSAKKMDGLINVNDIFKRQQIQIEENVLHLIELNEENSALQNEVTNLGAEVEHLTEKINSLTTNYEMLSKELAAIKAQLR